jgi:hypothetical protein
MPSTQAILAGLVFLVAPARAQQVPPVQVMVRIEARRDTLTIVAGDGRVIAFYAPVNARLSHVTVAPTELHVAALEHVVVPQSVARPHVVVLSAQGAVIARSARAARTYVWCCEGQQIAYIAGEPREGGVLPHGVYMLDIPTGAETLLPGLGSALELKWAPFDSSLYVKAYGPVRVVKYAMANARVTPTAHRDIDFSPGGRHYLRFSDVDDVVTRLYDAGRDVDISLPTPSELGLTGSWRPHASGMHWFLESGSQKEDLRLIGWAFDQGAILLFTHNRVTPLGEGDSRRARLATRDPIDHLLFDVGSRKVVGRLQGELLPWATPRGALPIKAAGRVGATTRAAYR